MAFCENCGRELSDQAIACPNCGHPRAPAVATQQASAYAEWWQRAVALIIDSIVIAVPAGIVIALTGLTRSSTLTTTDEFGTQTLNSNALRHLALAALIAFGIGILYRTILE